MSQENEIEETERKLTQDFLPSDGASCSPSSLTPETDVVMAMEDRGSGWLVAGRLEEHARKLERERDSARQEAARSRDSMRSGMVMQTNPPTLIFDWENDKSPPTGAPGGHNPKEDVLAR